MYGIVAIELSIYYVNAKPRSPKWEAISISRNSFKTLVMPVSYFVRNCPGRVFLCTGPWRAQAKFASY